MSNFNYIIKITFLLMMFSFSLLFKMAVVKDNLKIQIGDMYSEIRLSDHDLLLKITHFGRIEYLKSIIFCQNTNRSRIFLMSLCVCLFQFLFLPKLST